MSLLLEAKLVSLLMMRAQVLCVSACVVCQDPCVCFPVSQSI